MSDFDPIAERSRARLRVAAVVVLVALIGAILLGDAVQTAMSPLVEILRELAR